MAVRSDFTLRCLLKKIRSLDCPPLIQDQIDDALSYMGQQSPYRGGKALIELIDLAASEARRQGYPSTAHRLDDAAGYATGHILRQDIEAKYQLFDGARATNDKAIRSIVAAAFTLAVNELRQLNERNSHLSGAEILEHFEQLQANAAEMEELPDRIGHYRLLRGRQETSAWIVATLLHRVEIEDPIRLEATVGTVPEPMKTLTEKPSEQLVLDLLQLRARRAALYEIRRVVRNPNSDEENLRAVLHPNPWLFGGAYVDGTQHRRLGPSVELDLPLLRPDGSLHVVELKRANVKLVTHQRSRLIPNALVHRAVGQVMNYLLILDELRDDIQNHYGIDARRARGTVVIGHSMFEEMDASTIAEVLRTYNSHLSRVEVITYEELLESAQRSVELSSANARRLAEELER
jgi:hypothetical protein